MTAIIHSSGTEPNSYDFLYIVQFVSVLTKENMTNQPELKGNPSPDISHLEISEEGVKKLLSNVNPKSLVPLLYFYCLPLFFRLN
jgi:hypothetical protein